MTQKEKLIRTILDGLSDKNINFNELCNLLKSLGFVEHIRGSHHIFRKEDVVERINLQKDGTKAKAYQVKQVRNIILKYKLGGELPPQQKNLEDDLIGNALGREAQPYFFIEDCNCFGKIFITDFWRHAFHLNQASFFSFTDRKLPLLLQSAI